ncbi:MAG: TonB-dependent siderophore receptor [Cyanobacteria bacterium SW_9_44_58]|nr:MAG: TonB-dependent siderophore receptor [Cyanobacteria bacterium SW_9_44_58]
MRQSNLLAGASLATVVSVFSAATAYAQATQVTGVKIESTPEGVNLILETSDQQIPKQFQTSYGETIAIDLINTQLNLPEGERFQQDNPAPGIASVEVNQRYSNSVRITITGESKVPEVAISSQNNQLVVGLNQAFPKASTPSQPSAETEPSAPTSGKQDSEVIDLVVTATRTEEQEEKVPRSVTVINREEIEQQANLSRNLSDILGELVPGFSPSTQTNSIFGQTLRGRNPQVLIDGVPQSTNRNVQRDLRNIDPEAIERIEIVRGPSAIYGDGATGGVVNIITRKPTEETVSKAKVGINSSLTQVEDSIGFDTQYSLTGSNGKLDYVFSGSFASTGAFFDADGDRIPPDPQGQGGVSETDTFNILGKIGYEFDDQQRLQLSINHFNDQQDTDFARVRNPSGDKAEAREGLELPEQPETENTVINLSYSHEDLFLDSKVDAQLYYRDYLTRFSPFDLRFPSFGNNIAQSRVESEKFGGRLDIETPLSKNDNLSVLWGVDFIDEDTSQPADLFDKDIFESSNGLRFVKTGEGILSPPTQQNNLGLFAQLRWEPSDQWVINGGVRYENIGLDVDDFTTLAGNNINGGELDYDETVFNLGVVHNISDEFNAFANFSQGFSVADVPRALRTAADGSSVEELKPEAKTVDNYEIGVRGNWDNVQTKLSAFYNYSELGSTFDNNLNIIRAPKRIYGLEASIDSQVSDNWDLGGSLTWLGGENDGDDDGDIDDALPNTDIPPIKLAAYVENQTAPGWRNRFQALLSGSRDPDCDDFASGCTEVNTYFTVDWISRIQAGEGEIQIAVENLFNEEFFPIISQVQGVGNKRRAAG